MKLVDSSHTWCEKEKGRGKEGDQWPSPSDDSAGKNWLAGKKKRGYGACLA